MPNYSEVLEQLAESFRDDGAKFAPGVLYVMSAIEEFLATMGQENDEDVVAAAYLTALLKPEQARAAATRLGLPSTLMPQFHNLLSAECVLGQALGKGSLPRALVSAATLFAWCANSARSGDGDRKSRVRQIAENATQECCEHVALAKTLLSKIEELSISTPPSLSVSRQVFSISVDLAGSTDAKTRILSVAQNDPTRIDKLNGDIYHQFCEIEKQFYKNAVSHCGIGSPIDPASFFTVKGIGDEIWILCDVEEKDAIQVGQRLIDSAIKAASEPVNLFAAENEDGLTSDPEFNYGKIDQIRSAVKIFIDIVDHASDLGRQRDEALLSTVPALLMTYHQREPTSQEIAKVVRRISLSSYEPVGWKLFHEYRTDYIGHEVDRFFRTTKSAVPGTVTIGESLAIKLDFRFAPVKQGILAVHNRDGTRFSAGLPKEPVYAKLRTMSPDELKGIGYAYSAYALFAPSTLKHFISNMQSATQPTIDQCAASDEWISEKILDELIICSAPDEKSQKET